MQSDKFSLSDKSFLAYYPKSQYSYWQLGYSSLYFQSLKPDRIYMNWKENLSWAECTVWIAAVCVCTAARVCVPLWPGECANNAHKPSWRKAYVFCHFLSKGVLPCEAFCQITASSLYSAGARLRYSAAGFRAASCRRTSSMSAEDL